MGNSSRVTYAEMGQMSTPQMDCLAVREGSVLPCLIITIKKQGIPRSGLEGVGEGVRERGGGSWEGGSPGTVPV